MKSRATATEGAIAVTATFGRFGEFLGDGVPPTLRRPNAWLISAWTRALILFDTADIYSTGAAEEILGRAIKRRRDQLLISTKGTFATGDGPNDNGSSRAIGR
jgi:aryl-alcohol dehydrogenase-like predicted oxidoreductase